MCKNVLVNLFTNERFYIIKIICKHSFKNTDQNSGGTLENDWKKLLCFKKNSGTTEIYPNVLTMEFKKSNSGFSQAN